MRLVKQSTVTAAKEPVGRGPNGGDGKTDLVIQQ